MDDVGIFQTLVTRFLNSESDERDQLDATLRYLREA
jgi:hypothetical protein